MPCPAPAWQRTAWHGIWKPNQTLVFVLFSCFLRGAKNLWQVETRNGPLNGELVRGADDIEYYSFKGIPYAKPPLGELRFKVSANVWGVGGSHTTCVREGVIAMALAQGGALIPVFFSHRTPNPPTPGMAPPAPRSARAPNASRSPCPRCSPRAPRTAST